MSHNFINNPGNIILNGEHWQGEVEPSSDAKFKEFESLEYGYRACFINLRSYINKGLNTIQKIFPVWCPSSKSEEFNNPELYASHVAQWTGISKDKVLTLNDGDDLIKIVAAIARQEWSIDPPQWDKIQAGFDLQTSIKKK